MKKQNKIICAKKLDKVTLYNTTLNYRPKKTLDYVDIGLYILVIKTNNNLNTPWHIYHFVFGLAPL